MRLAAIVIDSDTRRAGAVLEALGASSSLDDGDLRRFYDEARAVNAGAGAWIILYDTTGQQLVNTRKPFGTELPVRPDPEQVTRLLASGKSNISGLRWGSALNSHFVMVEAPVRTPPSTR